MGFPITHFLCVFLSSWTQSSKAIFFSGSIPCKDEKSSFLYRFDSQQGLYDRGRAREDESNEFVSAVTWMKDSNVIIGANSQGMIKVLELN